MLTFKKVDNKVEVWRDGHRMTIKWSPEASTQLKEFHNVDIEPSKENSAVIM